MDKIGYIYILREREFIKSKEHIYKIGRTAKQNPFDRLKKYPKNSDIILIRKCFNNEYVEDKIKELFKNKYIQKKVDIGSEYFEGDVIKMTRDINKIVDDCEDNAETIKIVDDCEDNAETIKDEIKNENMYICTRCECNYDNQNELDEHMNKYKCIYNYSDGMDLTLVKTTKYRLKCEYCVEEQPFYNIARLKKHLKYCENNYRN
jgi:hypothetical protein